eukprot:gene5547-5783_t
MNDPHGMFQLKGTTHVFFQYNPKKIQWGAPFWGHVVSKDLARWTWLPPALLPDTPYDYNGCWSGAATVTDANSPVLTYTAASTLVLEYGNFFQKQALAVPEDLQDPWLKVWKKPSSNPFLVQVPPGGTNFQFRDPTEGRHAVWIALTDPANPTPLPKSSYALAIGVQTFCLGAGAIYAAPSMTGPWEYLGNLYNQLSIEPQAGAETEARLHEGLLSCHLMVLPASAAATRVCVLPGVFLLKWDDQSHFRGDFNAEWYVLGNGPWDYSALKPPNPGGSRAPRPGPQYGSYRKPVFGLEYSGYPNTTIPNKNAANDGRSNAYNTVDAAAHSASSSLFRGEIDGQKFAPMRMDYGSIYASMMFRTEDKRQVMLSWIYETAAGCEGSCSDQLPEVVAKQGFKGAISLPKQLTFNPATKTLRAYPIKEVELLRGKQPWTISGTKLGLSVWVDHSVIEVHAMGGLARATSRIYPENDDSAWGLAVWAACPGGATTGARVDAQVWEMNNMWLTPNC